MKPVCSRVDQKTCQVTRENNASSAQSSAAARQSPAPHRAAAHTRVSAHRESLQGAHTDLPQDPPYDVVAKADFNPEAGASQQLALRDGDQVKIHHDAQNGWLGGTKLDGTTGWLPKSWVRYVPGPPAPHSAPQPSLQRSPAPQPAPHPTPQPSLQRSLAPQPAQQPAPAPNSLPDSLDEWSVEDVSLFLRQHSALEKYCTNVVESEVNGPMLLELQSIDGGLTELGIENKIHQVKLRTELRKIHRRSFDSLPSPQPSSQPAPAPAPAQDPPPARQEAPEPARHLGAPEASIPLEECDRVAMVSHHQAVASHAVMWLQQRLERKLESEPWSMKDAKVWIDKSEKASPEGMVQGVKRSMNFILFMTRDVLTRDWCILEIRCALRYRKNIILVFQIDPRNGGVAGSFSEYYDKELKRVFPNKDDYEWIKRNSYVQFFDRGSHAEVMLCDPLCKNGIIDQMHLRIEPAEVHPTLELLQLSAMVAELQRLPSLSEIPTHKLREFCEEHISSLGHPRDVAELKPAKQSAACLRLEAGAKAKAEQEEHDPSVQHDDDKELRRVITASLDVVPAAALNDPKFKYDATPFEIKEDFPTAIISYATKSNNNCGKDDMWAIANVLRKNGITSFNGYQVKPGEDWQTKWYGKMPRAKLCVLILSEEYFTSTACADECFEVLKQKGRVIPLPVQFGT